MWAAAPRHCLEMRTKRARTLRQRGCKPRVCVSTPLSPFWLASRASTAAWECSAKTGGEPLPRLSISPNPIAHKYCEGKVKSTLHERVKQSPNPHAGKCTRAVQTHRSLTLHAFGAHAPRLETRTKELRSMSSARGTWNPHTHNESDTCSPHGRPSPPSPFTLPLFFQGV